MSPCSWLLRGGIAVCFLGLGGPAGAAVPKWSAPQQIDPSGVLGEVGIDGSGHVLASWKEPGSGRLMLSARRAGSRSFGAPVPAASGRAVVSQLEVNEAGDAALLYAEPEPCAGPHQCPFALSIRTGSASGRLGHPRFIGGHAGRFELALGPRGHAAVAWETEAIPLISGAGGIRVAIGPDAARFRSAQEVAMRGNSGWASAPSVAINERGDAVVGWEQTHTGPTSRDQGSAVYASYRPAGGRFGPPELVWDHRPTGVDGSIPDVAIDRDGDVTVLFDASGKRVADRPHNGRFRRARRLIAGGGPAQLLSNPRGDQVAMWTDYGQPKSFATRRPHGGSFSAPSQLIGPVFWSQGALDARGNLLTLGFTAQPGQRLVAGVHTRFGFLPQELSLPPPAMNAQPDSLDSNEAGAAIGLYSLYPAGYTGGYGAPLMMLERPADKSPPGLSVTLARPSRRAVSARVACDEPCRISAALRGAQARGRRSTAALASAASRQTLRPGHSGRLSIRLSHRERTRIRGLLRAGRRIKVRAVIRAEDASGNVRVRRRAVRAASLAR